MILSVIVLDEPVSESEQCIHRDGNHQHALTLRQHIGEMQGGICKETDIVDDTHPIALTTCTATPDHREINDHHGVCTHADTSLLITESHCRPRRLAKQMVWTLELNVYFDFEFFESVYG